MAVRVIQTSFIMADADQPGAIHIRAHGVNSTGDLWLEPDAWDDLVRVVKMIEATREADAAPSSAGVAAQSGWWLRPIGPQ